MGQARNHPVVIAAAAAVVVFSVLGAAALDRSGHTAASRSGVAATQPQAAPAGVKFESTIEPRAASTGCGDCGVIEAIRAVEADGVKKPPDHRVTLKMDDGSVRTLSQPEAPARTVGERVRVVNGVLADRG